MNAVSSSPRPYPGMRPFEADEAALFHGQDTQVSALLQRLGRSRLITVFGESGCGKSSIIKAGLIPRLLGSFVSPETALWRVAISRPARAPIRQLAEGLARTVVPGGVADTIERQLRASSFGLLDVVREAQLPRGRRVLIVIDQFEELFRFTRDTGTPVAAQDEAALFVKLLLASTDANALAASGTPVYVVLTMRSEYLGECARFVGLAEAVNDGAYLLPKMTRGNLEAAIIDPLRRFEAVMENDLLQRLLNETEAAQQDGLPLLQHALRRIWDRASQRAPPVHLTMADFESVGNDVGAGALLLETHLNAHLDEIWESLSPVDQGLCATLFKQLGEYDTKFRLIRRPVDLATLAAVCAVPPETLMPVVDAFRNEALARTFLMPPESRTRALLDGSEPLDISHEALLRRWRRLHEWVDLERKDADEFQSLADRANKHSQLGRAELAKTLAWKKRVAPTEAWSARYGGWDVDARGPRYRLDNALRHLRACTWRNRVQNFAVVVAVVVVVGATGFVAFLTYDRGQQQAHQNRLTNAYAELEATNGKLQDAVRLMVEAQASQAEEARRLAVALESERVAQRLLERERDRLVDANSELTATKRQLERQSVDLESARARAQERLTQALAEQARADELFLQLQAEQERTRAANERQQADQQFRLWSAQAPPTRRSDALAHLRAAAETARGYAAKNTGALSAEGVIALQRAVASSALVSSATDEALSAPVLLAMPDPRDGTSVAVVRQGAAADGSMSASPGTWTIQRSSANPGGQWVVGGQGGFAAIRSTAPGRPPLRKVHPFAVSGVGISTDGEWIASASAGGDLRLLRRADMDEGSSLAQALSRIVSTGKLLAFMMIRQFKGHYAVREFALSVAPHEGRSATRKDVTITALTEADQLLIWRKPGPIGKQTGVEQLEVTGRYAAIVTDPRTQAVWAAQILTPGVNIGILTTTRPARFTVCEALSSTRSVTHMAWDAAGRRLAIGFQDGTVRVMERRSQEPCDFSSPIDVPAHTAAVTTVSWHDQVLASGASDGSARLWNFSWSGDDRQLLDAIQRLGDQRQDTVSTLSEITAHAQRLLSVSGGTSPPR